MIDGSAAGIYRDCWVCRQIFGVSGSETVDPLPMILRSYAVPTPLLERQSWRCSGALLCGAKIPSTMVVSNPRRSARDNLSSLVPGLTLRIATLLPHCPPGERNYDRRKYDKRQNNIHWVKICHCTALRSCCHPFEVADAKRAPTPDRATFT